MKNTTILAGVISLVVAGLLFLFDITAYTWQIASSTVKVYPAAFFALLGVVLFFYALTQYRKKIDANS